MALHKDLTGTDLHEPKGVAAASANTVYVANGSGSGTWTALSERVPAGVLADWAGPVAPSGWAEADGTDLASATYPDLYTNMTIQQSGVRTNTSSIVTGLSSTANMKAGYYVFATGVAAGTIINSVDSSTQITLSNAASSTTTSTVYVSPWYVTGTTIRLPDIKGLGRFRRSRTVFTKIGDLQADANRAHSHTGTVALSLSGTATAGGAETMSTGTESATHVHVISTGSTSFSYTPGGSASGTLLAPGTGVAFNSGNASATHTHQATSSNHTHPVSFSGSSATVSINNDGDAETRPSSIVLMTIVRVT